jgi:hypothetical protein
VEEDPGTALDLALYGMLGASNANNIILAQEPATHTLTAAHEYKHHGGITKEEHRGEAGDNALMAPSADIMGPKINRDERPHF